MKKNANIPYYTEINDFLEILPWPGRTTNPIFYCWRLNQLDHQIDVYCPPFRRSFYNLALYKNSGEIKINYDYKTVDNPETYLFCHSPELIYSFCKGNSLEGYVIYFKPECFSFFRPDFHKEFPFFNRLYTNLFTLNRNSYDQLTTHFEEVFASYERNAKEKHMEARLKLLALLYHIKEIVDELNTATSFASSQQVLLSKYIRLVNNHYTDKRTVQEYAQLLSITTNHLSQTIKTVSGKNALSYIHDRLLREAKSLLLYTAFSISEIAYQLGFSTPAYFGKFFKKETGMPPSRFRDQQQAIKFTN